MLSKSYLRGHLRLFEKFDLVHATIVTSRRHALRQTNSPALMMHPSSTTRNKRQVSLVGLVSFLQQRPSWSREAAIANIYRYVLRSYIVGDNRRGIDCHHSKPW